MVRNSIASKHDRNMPYPWVNPNRSPIMKVSRVSAHSAASFVTLDEPKPIALILILDVVKHLRYQWNENATRQGLCEDCHQEA